MWIYKLVTSPPSIESLIFCSRSGSFLLLHFAKSGPDWHFHEASLIPFCGCCARRSVARNGSARANPSSHLWLREHLSTISNPRIRHSNPTPANRCLANTCSAERPRERRSWGREFALRIRLICMRRAHYRCFQVCSFGRTCPRAPWLIRWPQATSIAMDTWIL